MLINAAKRNLSVPMRHLQIPLCMDKDATFISPIECSPDIHFDFDNNGVGALWYDKVVEMTFSRFKTLEYFYCSNSFTKCIIDGGKDICICGNHAIIKNNHPIFALGISRDVPTSRYSRYMAVVFDELFEDVKAPVNKYIISDVLPWAIHANGQLACSKDFLKIGAPFRDFSSLKNIDKKIEDTLINNIETLMSMVSDDYQ